MTNLLHRVEVSLRSFYIFNSSYGGREGQEHQKILFYHPDDIEINTKIKDVGLSEAIITFTDTFAEGTGCDILHTLKTTQIFLQPEDGFWCVMTLNVPKTVCSKQDEEYEDYRNGEIHDEIYRKVLQESYDRFCLQYGSFDMILNSTNNGLSIAQSKLREKLNIFYSEYVQSLNLPICDVTQFLRSVQYLPLSKTLFLRVHNFIQMVQATFPAIVDTLFLFNDQIVSGGKFEPSVLFTMYNYIMGNRTLRRPQRLTEVIEFEGSRKIFLNRNNELMPFKIYHHCSSSASLYMYVKRGDILSSETREDLETYIDAQLALLAYDIARFIVSHSKVLTLVNNAIEPEALIPRYLFVNEQTLKHISNIGNSKGEKTSSAVCQKSLPLHVVNLLIDSATTTKENNNVAMPPFEETLIKSTTDFWIVKRQCNWRQFYVIIFNKKATLLDVTAEAERIFDQEVTDDVFFDK